MIARIIFVIIVVPFIAGPAPSGGCRWVPTSFFESLDKNSDRKISYVEWMDYYGTSLHSHSIVQCMRQDFYYADCNIDDELSWEEYFYYRLKGKSCGTSAVKTISAIYEENPEYFNSLSREQIKELIREKNKELLDREEFLKEKYGLSAE